MRKILTNFFWSLGTNLGYPGPGSQADVDRIFSKPQILVIWDPISLSKIVACLEMTKTLKTIPALSETHIY